MRWQSWADFWAMGGYGLYVWGSMGVTFVLMALEVFLARQARLQAEREVRQAQALNPQEGEAE
ncbi:MAG: heme exporter protein CcmD [Limnohabitans sp.]|jgi:heme exporter protein D|nr:heme exporter protein CcmD [Limnohabitans sp.]